MLKIEIVEQSPNEQPSGSQKTNVDLNTDGPIIELLMKHRNTSITELEYFLQKYDENIDTEDIYKDFEAMFKKCAKKQKPLLLKTYVKLVTCKYLYHRGINDVLRSSMPNYMKDIMPIKWKFVFRHEEEFREVGANVVFNDKKINYSDHMFDHKLCTVRDVRDTILHEIAHINVMFMGNIQAGHGEIWKEEAQRIGSSGRQCMPYKFSFDGDYVACTYENFAEKCIASHKCPSNEELKNHSGCKKHGEHYEKIENPEEFFEQYDNATHYNKDWVEDS
jgi:hypothetical protein